MNTDPQIEPVTDEDTRVAMQSYFINMKHILIHDRRRVAERQIAASLDGGEFYRLNDAKAEIERLRAEVARLTAAQANMIDATGAVESVVLANYVGSGYATVPAEWAGDRVKIVRVAK